MDDTFRKWTGTIVILVGIAFLFIPIVGWIYGVIGIILGILILKNKSENSIEERKDRATKSKGRKKQ